MKYEKSQTGWVMLILFSLIILNLTIAYLKQSGSRPLPLGAFLVLVVLFLTALLIFYRLKIRVDNNGLHVIYGIGLVHVKINPEKVFDVRIVKSPWYYGLGIRFTPKGMLYNVQGLTAVRLSYLEGKNKTVTIGSNDPERLKSVLEHKYGLVQ
jgi:hypothetical protein